MNSADLCLHRPRLGDVAAALDAIVMESSATALAQGLGVAPTTVSRHGADLSRWSSDHLLHMATADQGLRRAVIAAISGADPQGEAVAAVGHTHSAILAFSQAITAAATALKDGQISRAEAKGLLQKIGQAQVDADALVADLELIARIRS